jgi:glyoxylase-like metal-dependent hydrolase (beta-lactamase superfamily II)
MQIKFLGTGGAFDFEYGNSAAFLHFRGQRILVDCGNSVYRRLRETGLADHIDYILITHLHDDHVGSLNSTVLHHKYLLPEPRKARILIPSEKFARELKAFMDHGLRGPEDYVDFLPIQTVPGIKAIDTYGLHIPEMQTFAYLFEDENEIVAYSGDLGDPNIIFDSLPKNDDRKIRVFHEMSFLRHDVHTYYRDLMPRVDQYELYGYHLDPRQAPPDNTVPLLANFPDLLI